MSDQTKIEWTDSTFNPWVGCTKVSPGCDHCYAERDMDIRRHRVKWGAGNPRSRTSEAYWKQPLRWNAQPFYECRKCGWRGVTKYGAPVCCDEPAQLTRRRVFCASLADVFDNEVDPTWRRDLFQLIASTPNLDWLLLTKRIGNVLPMLDKQLKNHARWEQEWRLFDDWLAGRPPANVWLGATIVNQSEADRDIVKLLSVPAAVRFLSIEPMLGRIDLGAVYGVPHNAPFSALSDKTLQGHSRCVEHAPGYCMRNCIGRLRAVDWVIAGGESGPQARPLHPGWVRSLRDQCAAAGVPFLFKQWGEWAPYDRGRVDSRQLVSPDAYNMPARVGKKLAGRQLDGVEHNEFPAVT